MQVYDIPNRVGLSDFKKLLRNYQGKNVHVVWLNNPKVDYIMWTSTRKLQLMQKANEFY